MTVADDQESEAVTVKVSDPASAEARALLQELDAEIARIYPGAPFHSLTAADLSRPDVAFVIASVDGAAAACGALRVSTEGAGAQPARTGEIKRMYVRPSFRRRGLARAVLDALEREAVRREVPLVRIETGAGQPEAIALYRSAGYEPIEPFGEYIGNVVSRCFEKWVATKTDEATKTSGATKTDGATKTG